MEPAADEPREVIKREVERLRRDGICPTCFDLETNGALYGNRYVLYKDALFKVALETFPRMPVLPRQPFADGENTSRRIRDALESILSEQ